MDQGRNKLYYYLNYIALILIACIFIFPFIWLISTSFKGSTQSTFSFPPEFIPNPVSLENYKNALTQVPFMRYLFNTFALVVLMVPAHILLTALAAFPLARMQFRGRNLIFYLIIGTMFLPNEGKLIPLYLIIEKLGMTDSWSGIIFPGLVGGFSIYLMRQSYLSISKELDEAAIIDGCGPFAVWWRIILPLTKPTLSALSIFSFISVWNSFIWPLIVLQNDRLYPISLGLAYLLGTFGYDIKTMSAGTVMSIIPIVIFYLIMQKHFVSGIQAGAVKG